MQTISCKIPQLMARHISYSINKQIKRYNPHKLAIPTQKFIGEIQELRYINGLK